MAFPSFDPCELFFLRWLLLLCLKL